MKDNYSRVDDIRNELKKLEMRLDQGENEKRRIIHQNESMLRLERDMAQLERYRRENVEKDLDLVKSEIKMLSEKNSKHVRERELKASVRLNTYQHRDADLGGGPREEVQKELEGIERANREWGGVVNLLGRSQKIEKDLLVAQVENEQLRQGQREARHVKLQKEGLQDAVNVKQQRIVLLQKKQIELEDAKCDLETVKEGHQTRILRLESALQGMFPVAYNIRPGGYFRAFGYWT